MNARPEQLAAPTRLDAYRAPVWRVETVELDFDLAIDTTEVTARLHLRRDPAQTQPLRLDGENLELLSITLDGTTLSSDTFRYANNVLEVDGARDGFGVGDVEDRDIGFETFIAQPPGHGVGLRFIASVDDQRRARPRKTAREREADAASGARDQSAAPAQAEQPRCLAA